MGRASRGAGLLLASLMIASSSAAAPPSLPLDEDPRVLRLKAELDDEDPAVVAEAVRALLRMRLRGAVPYLIEVSKRLRDREVDVAIAGVVAASPSPLDPAATEWVFERLRPPIDERTLSVLDNVILAHPELHDRMRPALFKLLRAGPRGHLVRDALAVAIESVGVDDLRQLDAIFEFKAVLARNALQTDVTPRLARDDPDLRVALTERIARALPTTPMNSSAQRALLEAVVYEGLDSPALSRALRAIVGSRSYGEDRLAELALAFDPATTAGEVWRLVRPQLDGCLTSDFLEIVHPTAPLDETFGRNEWARPAERAGIAALARRHPEVRDKLIQLASSTMPWSRPCPVARAEEVLAALADGIPQLRDQSFTVLGMKLEKEPWVGELLLRRGDQLRARPDGVLTALKSSEHAIVIAALALVARVGDLPAISPAIEPMLASTDARVRCVAIAAHLRSRGASPDAALRALRRLYGEQGSARGLADELPDEQAFALEAMAAVAEPSWAASPAFADLVPVLIDFIRSGRAWEDWNDWLRAADSASNALFTVRALTPGEALRLLDGAMKTRDEYTRAYLTNLARRLSWRDDAVVTAARWLDGTPHPVPPDLPGGEALHLLRVFGAVVAAAPPGVLRDAAFSNVITLVHGIDWRADDLAFLRTIAAQTRDGGKSPSVIDALLRELEAAANRPWYRRPAGQTALLLALLVAATVAALAFRVFGSGRQIAAVGFPALAIAGQAIAAKATDLEIYASTPGLALSYAATILALAVLGVTMPATVRATLTAAPWTQSLLALRPIRKRAIRLVENQERRRAFEADADHFLEVPAVIAGEPSDRPVEALARALDARASVVITGIGGVGKTTLAHALLRRARAAHPDWLVATIDVSAGMTEAEILTKLGDDLSRPMRDAAVVRALLTTGPACVHLDSAGEVIAPAWFHELATHNPELRLIAVGRSAPALARLEEMVAVECEPVDEATAKSLEARWMGRELDAKDRALANIGDTATPAYLPFLLWMMCDPAYQARDNAEAPRTPGEIFDAYFRKIEPSALSTIGRAFAREYVFHRDARSRLLAYDSISSDAGQMHLRAGVEAGLLRPVNAGAARYVACVHDSLLAHLVARQLRQQLGDNVHAAVAVLLELGSSPELLQLGDPRQRAGGELFWAFADRAPPWIKSPSGTRAALEAVLQVAAGMIAIEYVSRALAPLGVTVDTELSVRVALMRAFDDLQRTQPATLAAYFAAIAPIVAAAEDALGQPAFERISLA